MIKSLNLLSLGTRADFWANLPRPPDIEQKSFFFLTTATILYLAVRTRVFLMTLLRRRRSTTELGCPPKKKDVFKQPL